MAKKGDLTVNESKEKREKRPRKKLDLIIRKRIVGIVWFLVSAIVFASLVFGEGNVVNTFLRGVFGVFGYPFWVLMMAVGVLIAINKKINIPLGYLINYVLLLFFLVSAVHMLVSSNMLGAEYIKKCYFVEENGTSIGGVISAVFIYLLYIGVGKFGVYFVLGALLVTTIAIACLHLTKFLQDDEDNKDEGVKGSNESEIEKVRSNKPLRETYMEANKPKARLHIETINEEEFSYNDGMSSGYYQRQKKEKNDELGIYNSKYSKSRIVADRVQYGLSKQGVVNSYRDIQAIEKQSKRKIAESNSKSYTSIYQGDAVSGERKLEGYSTNSSYNNQANSLYNRQGSQEIQTNKVSVPNRRQESRDAQELSRYQREQEDVGYIKEVMADEIESVANENSNFVDQTATFYHTEKLKDGNEQMVMDSVDFTKDFVLRTKKFVPYIAPPTSLLPNPDNKTSNDLNETAERLQSFMDDFGIKGKVENIIPGPTVALYEVRLGAGIGFNKFYQYQRDIARYLSATTELNIIPNIPGKDVIGVEVPLKVFENVYLRTLLETDAFKNSGKLRFALGIGVGGRISVPDLVKMPHLLIAGATGKGKSVCLNSLLTSLLYKYGPEEMRLMLVDAKMVELNHFEGIPHMLLPKAISTAENAVKSLNWLVEEMLRRYKLFARARVSSIDDYNALIDKVKYVPLYRIVLVIDELSDLVSSYKKELEVAIMRLAQMARGAGIHLILSTQRPSTDVITGVIKANFPVRIALPVTSIHDSRTIIDGVGAEKLCREGDLFMLMNGSKTRVQCAYIHKDDVKEVMKFIIKNNQISYSEEIERQINNTSTNSVSGQEEEVETPQKSRKKDEESDGDELIFEALREAVIKKEASASFLQAKLSIGFPRASKLIERMISMGFLGNKIAPSRGYRVLVTREEFNENYSQYSQRIDDVISDKKNN